MLPVYVARLVTVYYSRLKGVKREALVQRIRKAANAAGITFEMTRQGANHEVWRCGGSTVPIPRHREIAERLAEKIFKEVEADLGKDWWRQ